MIGLEANRPVFSLDRTEMHFYEWRSTEHSLIYQSFVFSLRHMIWADESIIKRLLSHLPSLMNMLRSLPIRTINRSIQQLTASAPNDKRFPTHFWQMISTICPKYLILFVHLSRPRASALLHNNNNNQPNNDVCLAPETSKQTKNLVYTHLINSPGPFIALSSDINHGTWNMRQFCVCLCAYVLEYI